MAGTNLSITRAGEDHLAVLAEIWMASVSDLVARYEPDYLDELSDPEDRLPGFRHLLATGAMFVASDSGPVGFSAAVV